MQSIKLQTFLPDISAGLISGLITLTYSMSYAALIFSGDLADFVLYGIIISFLSAAIVATVSALASSFKFTIAGPDGSAAAISAISAAAISTNLAPTADPQDVFVTVWMGLTLSTLFIGLLFLSLGRLGMSRLVRFIPYPVVGGFLAAAGFLLVQGSFRVMTNYSLTVANLSALIQPHSLRLWLPGLIFALVLRGIYSRSRHVLILPGMVLGASLLIRLGLMVAGMAESEAIDQGWLFNTFSGYNLRQPWQAFAWDRIHWTAMSEQAGTLLTLAAVGITSLLLYASSLELVTDQDADLDQEFFAAGIANVVAGFFGGMIGHLSFSRTLLNYKAGAKTRLAGLVAAFTALVVLLVGIRLFTYFPKAVLGGLLLYVGLDLLIEWTYTTWFQMSRADYTVVLLILIISARFGFLSGFVFGLLVACLLFVVKYSSSRVIRNRLSGMIFRSKFNRSPPEQKLLQKQGEQISIMLLQGYLFFGTTSSLLSEVRRDLQAVREQPVRFMILDFRLVSGLDSSAVNSFLKLEKLTAQYNVTFLYTNLTANIAHKLQTNGLIQAEPALGTCCIFPDLDRGVEWCESQIIEQSLFRRKRFIPLAMQLEDFFVEEEQIPVFMKYLEKIRADKEFVLFRQGEPADALYFIESGQVSLWHQLAQGQTNRFGTNSAGTIVGDIGLYRQVPHSATAIADQRTMLYKLSRQALDTMQREHPQVAAEFHKIEARLLADQLVQATVGVEQLLQ